MEVVLQIEVDNQPDRYTLSASLSAVLGLKQATRTTVLHTLWAYIKTHRLQVLLSGIEHLLPNGFLGWLQDLDFTVQRCRNVCFIMQQSERDRSMLPQQSVNYTCIHTVNSNSRWMTYSNADLSFMFGSG